MAKGGYKRIALAALLAKKRSKEQENQQLPEQHSMDRAYPTPDSDRGHSESTERISATKKRLSFADLPEDQQDRLRQSAKWNAEKQRLERAERKLQRKQAKKQRKKARESKLGEGQVKSMHKTEPIHTQRNKSALDRNQTKHGRDETTFADKAANAQQREEHDFGATAGQATLQQYGTERLEDVFVDVAPEHEFQLQDQVDVMAPQEPSNSQLPLFHSQPDRSDLIESRLYTPTRSPPTELPATPNPSAKCPDVLIVTPRRRPSPQLECIVSPESSAVLKTAANLLVTLKARTAHINTQIASFNRLHDMQTFSGSKTSNNSAAKMRYLRKILSTMERHSNEIMVMEYALRDVIDEGEGDVEESVRNAGAEFVEMVRVHEGKMRRYMEKLSPEAVKKTLEGVDGRSDEAMQYVLRQAAGYTTVGLDGRS